MSATTDEIACLEERLKELRKAAARQDEIERAAKERAYNALPYEWVVKTHPIEVGGMFENNLHLFPDHKKGDKVVGATVQRRKKGYDPEKHGHRQQADKWDGMTYFRTDHGVLYHCGGGTYVLYDPLPVTEEEWGQLCHGNIPERLKRP